MAGVRVTGGGNGRVTEALKKMVVLQLLVVLTVSMVVGSRIQIM